MEVNPEITTRENKTPIFKVNKNSTKIEMNSIQNFNQNTHLITPFEIKVFIV